MVLSKNSLSGLFLQAIHSEYPHDLIVFIRHKSDSKLEAIEKVFQKISTVITKQSEIAVRTFDLDKNSTFHLEIEHSPIIRIYKAGKLRDHRKGGAVVHEHNFTDLDVENRTNASPENLLQNIMAFIIDNSTDYIEFDDDSDDILDSDI